MMRKPERYSRAANGCDLQRDLEEALAYKILVIEALLRVDDFSIFRQIKSPR
jgi:hypothetical protein